MVKRFDGSTNGHLDAGDHWRMVRESLYVSGPIAPEVRQTLYTYFGSTDVPLATRNWAPSRLPFFSVSSCFG